MNWVKDGAESSWSCDHTNTWLDQWPGQDKWSVDLFVLLLSACCWLWAKKIRNLTVITSVRLVACLHHRD